MCEGKDVYKDPFWKEGTGYIWETHKMLVWLKHGGNGGIWMCKHKLINKELMNYNMHEIQMGKCLRVML